MITKSELMKRILENETILYDLEDRVIKLEKQMKKLTPKKPRKGKDEI